MVVQFAFRVGYNKRRLCCSHTHNLNCWNQEEYLGIGLAAHSYYNSKRFSNTDDLDEYIEENFLHGDKLPSNVELTKKFRVSSKTIHDAIKILTKKKRE